VVVVECGFGGRVFIYRRAVFIFDFFLFTTTAAAAATRRRVQQEQQK
jgi:hypothetical protein